MSLRQKRETVRAKGAAKRQNWDPDPSSFHFRIYRWWLKKSGKTIKRENLCHYMRVVLIWAPLRAAVWPLQLLLMTALAAICIYIAATSLSSTLQFFGLVLMTGYVFLGIDVVKQLLYELSNEEIGKPVKWLKDKTTTVRAGLVLFTLPVVVVGAAVIFGAGSLVMFLRGLEDDYRFYSRIRDWFKYAHLSDHKLLSWIRPWLVFPVALIVWSLVSGFFLDVAVVVGLLLTGLTVVALFAFLADTMTQRVSERKEKRREEVRTAITDLVLKRLFLVQHPEWVGNQERFDRWLIRYTGYCVRSGFDSRYEPNYWWHLMPVQVKYSEMSKYSYYDVAEEYRINQNKASAQPEKHPTKVKVVAVAIFDLLALAWAFVLTKKWRICPIIELPAARSE